MASRALKVASKRFIKLMTQDKSYHVLIIGPLIPPLAGQSVIVEIIRDCCISKNVSVEILNVSHQTKNVLIRIGYFLKFISFLIAKLIFHPKISILHVHTAAGLAFYEKISFVLLAKLFRKKTLLHIHGGQFKQFWKNAGIIHRSLIRWFLDMNNGLIVLGSSWKIFYEMEVHCRTPIFVLANTAGVLPKKAFKTQKPFTFLFVGHLKEAKGLLDLLEAMRQVIPQSESRVFLKIVGKGDSPQNEAVIRKAYMETHFAEIEFLGEKIGVNKWKEFLTSDAFVLPSYSEDMPISILEALAVGLPVLSTHVGCIPEIIENEVNGLLVDPGDVNGLAKNMLILANTPEMCSMMSQSNLQKTKQFYSLEDFKTKLLAIYEVTAK